jgi:hypothetical protein
MAHQYPLHTEVQVPCWCCRRPEWFTFKSGSDQVVCPACLRHLGDGPSRARQRDLDHVKWWEQEMKAARERRKEALQGAELRRQREVAVLEEEVTGLREQVADFQGALLRDLESRPVESVAVWFEQTKIAEADERTERARGLISHLFRVLWHVEAAHHVDKHHGERCTCGLKVEQCHTYKAMEPVLGKLYDWENVQVERIKKGLTHALPADHPEVRKREPWRTQRGA